MDSTNEFFSPDPKSSELDEMYDLNWPFSGQDPTVSQQEAMHRIADEELLKDEYWPFNSLHPTASQQEAVQQIANELLGEDANRSFDEVGRDFIFLWAWVEAC